MRLGCTHAIEIGMVFLPLVANMIFVSINFSLETIFVKFSPFVNLSCFVIFELNKFAMLQCDTGGFLW